MQGDDLQLQGDLACENAEIRGQLKVAGSPIGGSGWTDDGATVALIPGRALFEDAVAIIEQIATSKSTSANNASETYRALKQTNVDPGTGITTQVTQGNGFYNVSAGDGIAPASMGFSLASSGTPGEAIGIQATGGGDVGVDAQTGVLRVGTAATKLQFFAPNLATGAGSVKLTVTGSRGGNAALASLLTALAAYGLIVDGTSA